MRFKCESVQKKSALLDKVKALGKANSRTLGFFPEGAYEEHAANGNILAAKAGNGELAGYVLFRSVHRYFVLPKLVVVHLCVADIFRGGGVATCLISHLVNQYKSTHLRIELSCRTDYPANRYWPQFGFKSIGQRIGRGKDRMKLEVWGIELQDLPLLKALETGTNLTRVKAVLDANIIFRLQEDMIGMSGKSRRLAEEAKALESDWLNEVQFMKTDEIYDEISRSSSPKYIETQRSFVANYLTINTERSVMLAASEGLKKHFLGKTPSAKSDIKQIAHAIAGGAHYFITDDNKLLNKAGAVFKEYGLKILSPGQFIGSIDEVIREAEYYPAKLAGTNLGVSKLRSDDVDILFQVFRCTADHETKGTFMEAIRSFLIDPGRFDILLIRQGASGVLGMWVHDRKDTNILHIPFHRFSRSNLSATLMRYMVQRSISDSVNKGAKAVTITDDCFDDEFDLALSEAGFIRLGNGWHKQNIHFCGSSDDLKKETNLIHPIGIPEALGKKTAELLALAETASDLHSKVEFEKRLWPIKISDFPIPTFVLPIRPEWAKELFDENLAAQTLFDVREDLILKNENVYYRSVKNSGGLRAPSRLLWYVSKGSGYQGTMQIRACSYLDELSIDHAKTLFSRYKRLGVYEWNQVSSITRGNAKEELMALRFSNTQLFSNPVPLSVYDDIMWKHENRHPMLQSPQEISNETFVSLYRLATGLILSPR